MPYRPYLVHLMSCTLYLYLIDGPKHDKIWETTLPKLNSDLIGKARYPMKRKSPKPQVPQNLPVQRSGYRCKFFSVRNKYLFLHSTDNRPEWVRRQRHKEVHQSRILVVFHGGMTS